MINSSGLMKSKDLGFFNGIKGELITLLTGLVSFSLLADSFFNQLKDIFVIDAEASILLFIRLYFIWPVLAILIWLTLINDKTGLKKYMMSDKSPRSMKVHLFVLIGSLIITQLLFIMSRNDDFTFLCWWDLLLIIGYAIRLIKLKPLNTGKFRHLYRQAKIQFVVSFGLILLVGTYYFRNRTQDKSHLFSCIIDDAGKAMRDLSQSRQRKDTLQINLYGSTKILVKEISQLGGAKDKEAIKKEIDQLQGKINLIRVEIFEQEHNSLSDYREKMKPLVDMMQVRGMAIFGISVLFLLGIWYNSYVLRLQSETGEKYPEITISKVSVYFIFLLAIPFFKPNKKENIDPEHPFLSTSIIEWRKAGGVASQTFMPGAENYDEKLKAELEAMNARMNGIEEVSIGIKQELRETRQHVSNLDSSFEIMKDQTRDIFAISKDMAGKQSQRIQKND